MSGFSPSSSSSALDRSDLRRTSSASSVWQWSSPDLICELLIPVVVAGPLLPALDRSGPRRTSTGESLSAVGLVQLQLARVWARHPIWHFFWHSICHIFWHSICHYLSSLLTFYLAYLLTSYLAYPLTFYLAFYLEDFLTCYLEYHLTFYLAHLLTFYLAYLLTFYPAYLLTFYLEYLSGILSGRSSDMLSGKSSGILSRISSDILSGIYLAFSLAFYMAVFLAVEVRLKSGEPHSAQTLAGWRPDRMSEDMPDRISNRMPNRMPEDWLDRMSDGMNWMPWWGSLESKQGNFVLTTTHWSSNIFSIKKAFIIATSCPWLLLNWSGSSLDQRSGQVFNVLTVVSDDGSCGSWISIETLFYT